MIRIVRLFVTALLWGAWLGVPRFAAENGKVTSAQIAKGVYLFQTTAYGDVGFGGNSVVILTDEGVVVFDTSGTPASGKAILDGIQKLTNKPVLYVINSHWHWDHWGGNQVFKAAYPNVQFLSYEKNLDQMMHVAIPWNVPGLEKDLPEYISQLKEKLKTMEGRHVADQDVIRLRTLLAADEDFLKEKRSVTYTFPNVTFSDQVTLRLGGREIQVLHARAITPGDTYVYLPQEKLLITGDILVYPIPFAVGGSFPQEWIDALKRFEAMGISIIVPGHGDAEHDRTYLQQNLTLFLHVLGDVKDAKAKGLTLDQIQAQMATKARTYAADLSLPEGRIEDFLNYFLTVFVLRSYYELQGTLGDTPTS